MKDLTTADIAQAFCRVLKRWLSEDELAQARVLNAAETNKNICHTHDFCDANMAMEEAMNEHGLYMPSEDFVDEPPIFTLWSQVWNIAKSANLEESKCVSRLGIAAAMADQWGRDQEPEEMECRGCSEIEVLDEGFLCAACRRRGR